MPLEIVTLPCLSDNYVFLLNNPATGQTAVVDVPDAAVVQSALSQRGWQLSDILITHHHDDHIGGVEALRAATGARVIGATADKHRLPALSQEVHGGDTLEICGEPAHVFDVSGHTVGHIAYHFPQSAAVFTGDSLMALGCGRLFEGDAPMMWASLSRLAALPGETLVYSGHEYTATNAAFAATVEPDNTALQARTADITAARARNEATVPSLLADELATNPFLRAALPEVKELVGMAAASDAEVFGEIRRRKDAF